MNGLAPGSNWTGLFRSGERVRLRFINASAVTFYDVRIPGLPMTVVQADGQNVKPVKVDEFRIGVAETYDVIVQPGGAQAYTIFAETTDRSGYARGTLAVRDGLSAPIPDRRNRPVRTMADMGMAMTGDDAAMANMPGMKMTGGGAMHGPDKHGPGNSAVAMAPTNRLGEPGAGLEGMPWRVLVYNDLQSLKPGYDTRPPEREIELHATGNMERYEWSINGVKYEDADPVVLQYGERVRFKFVNETMMTHPMHLHGMWSILDVGEGKWNPIKHVVSVSPATTVYMETEVDAPGQWAFHCHLSYHAAAGMFRKIIVEGGPETEQAAAEDTINEDGGDA
jgi:L-ascorbate oxidase